MTQELIRNDEGLRFTQEKIDLIKRTVAKGSTDDELSMFTMIAQKYGLDPFLKEIWFIKRPKKEKKVIGGKDVWDYKRLPNGDIDYTGAETLIMTSRDGYLKVAQNHPEFIGIIGFVVRDGDEFVIDADSYKVNHKFGGGRGQIIGAWAKVDRRGRQPVITFADFKEYNDIKSTTWQKYPSSMILKVAEVMALKRQFGISGLVTQEEMSIQQDDIPTATVEDDKPKVDYKERIREMIREMSNGDEEEGKNLIIKYSTFERDGKEYWRDNLDSNMNDRWLQVMYAKVKQDYIKENEGEISPET